jgi:uncharacterized protein YbbC (DUF1343 family)
MEGYKRGMYFEDTGANWVVPSPNLPTVDSCFTFNCSCIFEGTNVSEGRGTTKPFSFIGAPWINGHELTEKLNKINLPGVRFRSHYFTPMLYHKTASKYPGELCGGIEIHVLDRNIFKPVRTAITILYTIRGMYGGMFNFSPPYTSGGKHMVDYNTGGPYIREGRLSLNEVLNLYERDSNEFAKLKEKYHIYREG